MGEDLPYLPCRREHYPGRTLRGLEGDFPSFWPRGSRFYIPLAGIKPGEVEMLTVRAGDMPLSTGVLVLYDDDESFTLMTPQGHMFAGWITLSAYRDEGCIVAQAQVLIRANDPIYELGLRLGGHRFEDAFWQKTLSNVAARVGVTGQPVDTQVIYIDPKVRWAYVRNIVYNAAIRTMVVGPARWFRRG